jgi:transposase InsO family protein
MRRATGKAITIILVREVFMRFGPPERLLTDNGSQFVSRFLKAVCKK